MRGARASWGSVLVLVVAAGCANEGSMALCGDGACSPGGGESCTTCAADCGPCAACGDGACTASIGESCASCAADCGACPPSCGNGACDGAETCSSCPGDCGACTTSCSAATCAGCCVSGVCESGTAPTACGAGGNACMACAPGFACVGGGCTVDPASRWNVVLEHVEVSSTYYTGEAWDPFGGAPEPYVQVRVGSESATPAMTSYGTDTFAVTFGPGPTVTNQRADALWTYLRFDVWDEDSDGDDFVGACVYEGLGDAAFTGATQTLTCARSAATMNSGFTLRWHLEQF